MKILGHNYRIERTHEEAVADNFCGRTLNNRLRIQIDPSLPRTEFDRTILHEVLEAINYRLELKLEHPQITAISEAIGCVLEENKMKTNWEKIK